MSSELPESSPVSASMIAGETVHWLQFHSLSQSASQTHTYTIRQNLHRFFIKARWLSVFETAL